MHFFKFFLLTLVIFVSGCNPNKSTDFNSKETADFFHNPTSLSIQNIEETIIGKRLVSFKIEVESFEESFSGKFFFPTGKISVAVKLNEKSFGNIECDTTLYTMLCTLEDVPTGELEIYAKYTGDTQHLDSDTKRTYTIKTISSLLDWQSSYLVQNAYEPFTLTLEFMTFGFEFPPKLSGTVNYKVYNKDFTKIITECTSQELKQDYDFIFPTSNTVKKFNSSCDFEGLSAGIYFVIATYSGDQYYAAANTTNKFGTRPLELEIEE